MTARGLRRSCPAEPNQRVRRRAGAHHGALMPLLLAPPVDEPAQVIALTEAVNRPCVAVAGTSPDVSPGVVSRARAKADDRILPLVVVLLVDVAAPSDLEHRAAELFLAGADDILVLPGAAAHADLILGQLEADALVHLLGS